MNWPLIKLAPIQTTLSTWHLICLNTEQNAMQTGFKVHWKSFNMRNFFEGSVGLWMAWILCRAVNKWWSDWVIWIKRWSRKEIWRWRQDRFFRSELFNIKILRETCAKVDDRHFCQNGSLNYGATKYRVILLGKLAIFPSTKNKNKKPRKQEQLQ